MKKCPTCERTFEETMRFCQADGTPLVEDAPALDPYKTMVSSSKEIANSIPVASDPAPAEPSAEKDHEVLQLPPDRDPKKTMIVSEEEIRREMASHDEPVVDLPPLAPEPPKFTEPKLSAPSFGDSSATPPPSPFAPANVPPPSPASDSPFSMTTPPIPSPFGSPKPSAIEAPADNFDQRPYSEPTLSPPAAEPPDFTAAPIEAAATPLEQNWEPNEPMQNQPFSPTSAAAGQNKTLAIVSLVLGILSIFCCGFLSGIPAAIVGFMARSKVNSNPMEYGGAGLALGGIITGIVGTILGIILLIANILLGGFGAISSSF